MYNIATQAAAEGRLLEVFGAGTACTVQPVEALLRANGDVLRAQVCMAKHLMLCILQLGLACPSCTGKGGLQPGSAFCS